MKFPESEKRIFYDLKRYRWWCFVFLALVSSIIVSGCGLPDYETIDAPTSVTYIDDNPSNDAIPTATMVAFKTPVDDTNIVGYKLYYKIYISQTDFDVERDESYWFDEGTYININAEMQPGSVIPNQRGFFLVGEKGAKATSEALISVNDAPADTVVYFYFDPDGAGASNNDLRKDPVYDTIYQLPPVLNPIKTLARGFVDPTDQVDDTFRAFSADWDYETGDGYTDADLRRKGWPDVIYDNYNLLHYQPGSLLKADGVTTVSSDIGPSVYTSPPGESMIIGFVVHAFGRDFASGQFDLNSKPVFIGVIPYSGVNETGLRTSTNR